MTVMRNTQRLRSLLNQGSIVVAPGAYDAWSAKLIERAGFSAVYMTGYGAAASHLGLPDLGLMTGIEMAGHASRISGAVSLPVIADADNGYGDVLNVQRTVRLYEGGGVAAIQLEDQVSPKRCGHMEGKRVVESSEMVRKVKAAFDARLDPDFVIIARTDARAEMGMDEALRRGEAYVEAGADMLFVESPVSDDELQKICEAFRGVPLLANMALGSKTPYHSAKELNDMGFSLVIYPIEALLVATAAMVRALDDLRENGRLTEEVPELDFRGFNAYMGLNDYINAANRYL